MFDVKDICSLSEFQRNTRTHLNRLKRSGKPEILTVNGKAALVVQDAASYQRLLEAADLADSVKTLRARLEGDRAHDVPAERVLGRVRAALGLPETE
jgi:PHD/YefM family antitoxin component YafN of YafNO toxin-antitoxin module